MTYGTAISVLKDAEKEKMDAPVMLEAIDKILSMATINAVSKDALRNAVRFLRNCVCEIAKELEPKKMELRDGELYCPWCGEKLESYYKFCNECGQAVKFDA